MANGNDAVDGAEKPVLDAVEDPKPEEKDEFTKMLESYGVSSPDDLASLVSERDHFKRSYGSSQNEVGQLRRDMEALKGQVNQPKEDDLFNEPDPFKNIDERLEKAVFKVIGTMNEHNQKASSAYHRKMAKFQKEPDWGVVGEYFNKALYDPSVQQAMSQTDEFGEPLMTMDSLYSTLRGRVLASRLKDTINKIPKTSLSSGATPSTEDRHAQPLPANLERQERINRGKEAGDAEAVLNALIPDGDPILRY